MRATPASGEMPNPFNPNLTTIGRRCVFLASRTSAGRNQSRRSAADRDAPCALRSRELSAAVASACSRTFYRLPDTYATALILAACVDAPPPPLPVSGEALAALAAVATDKYGDISNTKKPSRGGFAPARRLLCCDDDSEVLFGLRAGLLDEQNARVVCRGHVDSNAIRACYDQASGRKCAV